MRTHLMTAVAALALVVGLAACTPKPKDAATDATAAPASTETAQVETASDGTPPACSTGRTKAVTNVCDDGNPALFRAVNAKAPLLSPKCVWITEQLMISDKEFLVFRSQDCSAEGWDGAAYAYADGKVKQGAASTPYAIDNVILEIMPLGKGQDPQQVAINTLSTAPETERARCTILAVEDAPLSGSTFQVAPNAEFMTELDQTGQKWTACGDYGVGGGFHFFEPRGSKLFFHRLPEGPTTYWDPASFTFYRPDATGAWRKSAE